MTLPASELPQWERDAALMVKMEERLETKAVKPLRHLLALMLALVDELWPGDKASDLEKVIAIRTIETRLSEVKRFASKLESTLIDSALEALTYGTKKGISAAGRVGVPVPAFKAELSDEVREAATNAAVMVIKKADLGTRMLRAAKEKEEVKNAVYVATSGLNNASLASRWMTNAAANEGLRAVAEQTPELTAIVKAERDGCLTCLSKAGTTEKPPFHPRCRCTSLVLEAESAKAVAQGLKREAERSILRGWSLPGESEAKRLEAARSLLARGTSLPKSVQNYARKAIREGHFPRGRDFPGL